MGKFRSQEARRDSLSLLPGFGMKFNERAVLPARLCSTWFESQGEEFRSQETMRGIPLVASWLQN
jgi:hypothetical protein